VVVTPEVVFGWAPTIVLVTLKVTVQVLLAGIVIPEKLSAVAPAASVGGFVPTQVPPTAPAAALMFASVSVTAPPFKSTALLLDRVRVTREVKPEMIDCGLKALVIVGTANT
jgi:hypothetical protein